MIKIGFVLSSLALLASCKTVPRADSESKGVASARPSLIKLPIFSNQEWQKHTGGPTQEPFFLQDQLYTATITAASMPTGSDKVPAEITFSDSQGNVIQTNRIGIKMRGFTSRDFPKKQYGITMVDEAGKDKACKVLDMPEAEDWVLSAPYNDKSLLRDVVAYNFSNKLGRHAARTRIISLKVVVAQGAAQDLGVYVVTEKNDFSPNRINIPKKSAEGTSFQGTFDHLHDGDNVVWSGRNTDVVLEYPSAKKITPEQQAEFMEVFNDAESRIANPTGAAWNTIFQDRLDLDTAVDFFIGQEFTRNADGFRLSSGFYMPPKGKIHFGPLWDFNIAYGNAAHENGIQWDGWRSLENGVWFGTLLSHPEFCSALKTRWTAARADGRISNGTIFNIIDKHAAIMQPITDANFKKWPSLGRYLWPNPYWFKTWDDEKDALKSWISLRTEWMDEAINAQVCDGSQPINFAREAATDEDSNQHCDEGEVCTYTGNGLIWRRDAGTPMNHVDASRGCGALNNEQTSGWRLPRDTEWMAAKKANIWSVRSADLLNISDELYWSNNGYIPGSEPYGKSPNTIFAVNPKTGARKDDTINSMHRQMCVRKAE